jgi:hypothetical protein
MPLHAEGTGEAHEVERTGAPHAYGDDYFNRGHWLTPLQIWMSLRKRADMYEIWRQAAGSLRGRKVLDFGTTPDVVRADSNCFIRWLLRDGAEVSVVSVEELSNLAEVFPSVRILPRLVCSGADAQPRVAAATGEFDWVCSSAVIEHVGSRQNQIEHLRECGRVARGVFLTTPAREHWLEFHTKLPLIHWLPRERHRRLLRFLGHHDWSREDWLRLLSASELLELAHVALDETHELTLSKVRALGATSNLALVARCR